MDQMYSLKRFIAVVLATFALTTFTFGQTTPLRQKAVPAPSKSQAAAPVTMTECEGVNNCATWTFLGTQGNGQWPSGEVANLTVEHYDNNSVVIRRADSTGSSAGLTAVYTGTRQGDRVGGEFTSTWPGHWENRAGNWYAMVDTNPLPPPTMRFCGPMACATLTWNNGHYDAVGDGAPKEGPVGTYTVVSFKPEAVRLHRVDPNGTRFWVTGKISPEGNSLVDAQISPDGWEGSPSRIQLTWGTAFSKATEPLGPTQPQAQPRPTVVVAPVVCVPWFFGVVCGR